MKLYDLVRTDDPEVLGVLESWGVNRVEIKLHIARNLEEAKQLIQRTRILFTPRIDAALASLASQGRVHLGLFFTDLWDHGIRNAVKWIRIAQGFRVPVLLASGARKLSELRHPLDVASTFIALGMRRENALSAVSRRWREMLEGP